MAIFIFLFNFLFTFNFFAEAPFVDYCVALFSKGASGSTSYVSNDTLRHWQFQPPELIIICIIFYLPFRINNYYCLVINNIHAILIFINKLNITKFIYSLSLILKCPNTNVSPMAAGSLAELFDIERTTDPQVWLCMRILSIFLNAFF